MAYCLQTTYQFILEATLQAKQKNQNNGNRSQSRKTILDGFLDKPLTANNANNTVQLLSVQRKDYAFDWGMDVELFYEDEFLKISYLDASNSNRCLIAFTGVGHAMGGVDVQREEFFSQHALGMVVWVTDKRRSWGNNLKVEAISSAIQNLIAKREVFFVGNSMGGFLAILFSSILNAKRVMAFVPQFSVSPNIVPCERRWINYRSEIKKFVYEDLSQSFNANTEYALLMGSGAYEEVHYQKFSKFSNRPNVHMLKFTDVGHNVADYLKELNVLNECIDIFFRGDSLEDFFERSSIRFLDGNFQSSSNKRKTS